MHCRTCYDFININYHHHIHHIDEFVCLPDENESNRKTLSQILFEIAGIDTKNACTLEFQHLCDGCVNKIKFCFEFILKAQKVNAQLLQQFNQNAERGFLEEMPIDFPTPSTEIKLDIEEYEIHKTEDIDDDDDPAADVKVEEFFPDPIVQLDEGSIEALPTPAATTIEPIKCPIEETESDNDDVDTNTSSEIPTKRGRGRPRKMSKSGRAGGKNTCEVCGKSFIWLKDMIRHKKTHNMKPELKCDYCDRLFFRRDKLNNHKKTHFKKLSETAARYHATKRTEWNFAKCLYGKPVLKLVLCKLCGSEFSKISELYQHLLSHTDPSSFTLQHAIAVKDFAEQLEWQSENDIKSNVSEDIRKSNFAPYYSIVNEFGYELSLSDSDESETETASGHNQDVEMSEWNKYNCMLCNQTFRHQYQIFSHALDTHLNVKLPLKCNVCKVSFVSSEMLQNHERRQCKNKARKFQCSDCPGKFMWSENFENHQCSNDQSISSVKTTMKSSSSSSTSTRSGKCKESRAHSTTASRRTTKKLQCGLCEKTFIWPKDLTRHMRIHLPDREKFHCPICQRRFNRKDNMQVHMKVHGDEASSVDTKKKDTTNSGTGKQSKVQAVDENLTRPHGCKVIECTVCQSKQMRLSDLKVHLMKHQFETSYIERWGSIEKIAETIYPELGKSLTKDEITHRIGADIAAHHYERFYSATNEIGYELNLSSSETDTDSDTDSDGVGHGDTDKRTKKLRGKSSNTYTCELCDEKFDRKYKIFKHQSEIHSWDTMQYTCIHCNSKFVSRRLLDWHYNRQCKNTLKRYLCKKCPLRFMWKHNLEAHVRTTHSERLPEKLKSTRDSGLRCSKCNRQFIMQKDLTRHVLMQACVSESTEILKCLYCPRKFYRKDNLFAHIERHGITGNNYATAECIIRSTNKPNGAKQIYCRVCNITFSRIGELREHLIKETASPTISQHYSIESPLNYSITNSLGFEMQIDDSETEDDQHTTNSSFSRPPYQCAICNIICKRKFEMSQHQLSMHKYEQLPFQCDRCIFRTVCQVILGQHMRSQCYNDDKKYQCEACQFKFMWPEHLETHQRLCHSEMKPDAQQLLANNANEMLKTSIFQCEQCPCKYNRKDRLNAHIKKIHLSPNSGGLNDGNNSIIPTSSRRGKSAVTDTTGAGGDNVKKAALEKKFLCAFCGRGLTSSSNLIIHMRRHTGEKPYKCDFCHMAFPRSSDLSAHRRKHTGERPFSCTVCDKKFSRSYKLMLHMRIHTGERPHKCTYCEKSFTQSNDLTLHIRRHTGERPYVCGCGERFIQGTALKNHRMMRGHFEEAEEATLPPA